MAHVSQQKKEIVKKITDLAGDYPIIGVVNMANLPAKQLQNMREQLRGKVLIFMTKRRLMKVAFEGLKGKVKNVEALHDHLAGQPAMIFTKDNPFTLFRILKKNKSSAPAKAGQTAPRDIVVPAGPTPFAPGPVIGELGALGVKTQVEGGKIAVIADVTVCKEGKEIKQKLAEMLTRLGIEPMEVGLDLNAILEDGIIYTRKVLDIDEDVFAADLQKAASWAFNLAVEAAYPCESTIGVLIGKSFRESKAVAIEAGILTSDTADDVLGLAERQMLALKKAANIEVPKKAPSVSEKDKKKEEPKEEQKPEAKPEPKEEPKADVLPEPKEEQKPEPKTVAKPKAEALPEQKEQSSDDKIAKMVEETKKFAKGEIPSAKDLVEEATKEDKPKKAPEKVPTAHELQEAKKNAR